MHDTVALMIRNVPLCGVCDTDSRNCDMHLNINFGISKGPNVRYTPKYEVNVQLCKLSKTLNCVIDNAAVQQTFGEKSERHNSQIA